MNPDDVNQDGISDWQDVQARNRRLDQEDSARAVREIGATLSQGVRNLGAAVAGLWRNVTAIPKAIGERIARTKVRIIFEMVPQEARDTEVIYAWCFPFPPKENVPAHEHYRRWFIALLFDRIADKGDSQKDQRSLQMADVLAMLAVYGDDPLYRLMQSAIRRRAAPSTKPRVTAPAVEPASMPMGFAGIPAAPMLFTPVTQVLAVLLALAVMFGLWKDGQAKDAARYRDELRNEQTANKGLGERVIMAEEALQESRIAQEAYEKKIADQQARDAALAARTAAILRREKERQNAIRNSSGGVSDDDLLRELAQPASDVGDDPVPADPAAAAAEGVQREVPGAPGGDAATDAGPDR